MVLDLVKKIGILRFTLMSLVVTCIIFSFFSAGQVAYSGWAMVPTLLVPALTPIVFFGLAFDVMMSSILFSDNTEEKRSRFKFILLIEILLLVSLTIAWLPYFLSVGS